MGGNGKGGEGGGAPGRSPWGMSPPFHLGSNWEVFGPFLVLSSRYLGARWRKLGVLVFFRFVSRPDPILAPCWLHLSASGPHLGSIWEVVFGCMLVPSSRYLGALGRKRAGGVTRSVKNSICWDLGRFCVVLWVQGDWRYPGVPIF